MPDAVKLYIVKHADGSLDIVATTECANMYRDGGSRVYAIDVVPYVPTPPKEDLWTVVDRQGAALHKHFMCGVKAPGPLAITFSHMDEAIMLRDILERNGMPGLTVRKIEEE